MGMNLQVWLHITNQNRNMLGSSVCFFNKIPFRKKIHHIVADFFPHQSDHALLTQYCPWCTAQSADHVSLGKGWSYCPQGGYWDISPTYPLLPPEARRACCQTARGCLKLPAWHLWKWGKGHPWNQTDQAKFPVGCSTDTGRVDCGSSCQPTDLVGWRTAGYLTNQCWLYCVFQQITQLGWRRGDCKTDQHSLNCGSQKAGQDGEIPKHFHWHPVFLNLSDWSAAHFAAHSVGCLSGKRTLVLGGFQKSPLEFPSSCCCWDQELADDSIPQRFQKISQKLSCQPAEAPPIDSVERKFHLLWQGCYFCTTGGFSESPSLENVLMKYEKFCFEVVWGQLICANRWKYQPEGKWPHSYQDSIFQNCPSLWMGENHQQWSLKFHCHTDPMNWEFWDEKHQGFSSRNFHWVTRSQENLNPWMPQPKCLWNGFVSGTIFANCSNQWSIHQESIQSHFAGETKLPDHATPEGLWLVHRIHEHQQGTNSWACAYATVFPEG